MKKRKIKEDPAVRAGREFLEAFHKIPYNEDRIGQSFIMSISIKRTQANDIAQKFSFKEERTLGKPRSSN